MSRQVHGWLAAVLAIGIALTVTAGPAQAAYAVSVKASTTSPTVGTKVALAGSVGGGSAAKVVQQYFNGVWRTQATAVPRAGRYSFALTRTNPGVVPYRVIAVDARGKHLAVSPTVRVRWFQWQNLTLTQAGNQSRWVVGGGVWDQAFSFNGASYEHSLGLRSFGGTSASVSKFQLDVRLGKNCTTLRYTSGFAAGADGRNTGTVEILADGNGVSSEPFSPAAPHRVSAAIAGHDLISIITTASFYRNADYTRQTAVVGTPQVLCLSRV